LCITRETFKITESLKVFGFGADGTARFFDLGSCREVINDGQTGFLVNNVREAVRASKRIDRSACRRIQQCFAIETMVEAYERVYSTIFDLEARKQS
jgi:hypothetical protein